MRRRDLSRNQGAVSVHRITQANLQQVLLRAGHIKIDHIRHLHADDVIIAFL
jgi:hypothetical protein